MGLPGCHRFTNTPVPPQTIQPCQSGCSRSRQSWQRNAKLVTYRKIQSPERLWCVKLISLGPTGEAIVQSVLSELIPKSVFLCLRVFRVLIQTFCIINLSRVPCVKALTAIRKKGRVVARLEEALYHPSAAAAALHIIKLEAWINKAMRAINVIFHFED